MPRLLPDEPLPPYTFVPGRTPHPVSDPAGHMHGLPSERPLPPEPSRWRECRAYLRGVDLFNHGYYWEAHEAWEGLWHACGRAGPTADFLRGLIKLAAAGVKAREGVPEGVADHARRAAVIFRDSAQLAEGGRFFGLRIQDLAAYAAVIETTAADTTRDDGAGVRIVFDFVLNPESADGA